MDALEILQRLAINDGRLESELRNGDLSAQSLDPRTLALVRIAALVAVGGAEPSFGAEVDAAVSTGVSLDQIVDVVVGVVPVVGLARAVAAAPGITLALGMNLDGPGEL